MDENLIQDVYDSLCGQLEEEYRLPWVENAFAPGGRCDENYAQMLGAYGRLCARLGAGEEDADVETIINSLLDIQRELCRRMFLCGAEYVKDHVPRP